MATRNHTKTNPLNLTDFILVTWSGLLNGDSGDAVALPHRADKTAQFLGTFGSGGTVKLQGSNDGTNWVSLADPQGNELSKTAAAIEQVLENPLYIRPTITAGDGDTNLTVTLSCWRG